MDTAVEKTSSTPWFLEALGEVAVFAARLLKNFVIVVLIGAAFALLMVPILFVAGGGGVTWRGSVAAGVGLVGCGFITFLCATQLSIVITLTETVKVKQLGRRILDMLFAELFGVTPENPQGNHELSQAYHGLPVEEFEVQLKQAGNAINQKPFFASLPRIALWLVNKAQRLLVWATVRVVISYATASKSRSDTIDMSALKVSLASHVDNMLVDKIRQGAFRFVLVVIVLYLLGCWALVFSLSKIFGT